MAQRPTQLELNRLRASLGTKLVNEARNRGVAADPIRKQYIFTIFLSRIFQNQDAPFVLLGGNALLIRTGGGRFTQDIDLARETPWIDAEEVLAELRRFAGQPYRADPFEFELASATIHREVDPSGYGAETAKVKARALLGGHVFESFSIDLTVRRHLDAPVDRVPLKPVIDHETLRDLPTVPTTPVEHHLADKICALYERYGSNGATSSRYRDLADIVRIVAAIPFDAGRLIKVLETAGAELLIPIRRRTEVLTRLVEAHLIVGLALLGVLQDLVGFLHLLELLLGVFFLGHIRVVLAGELTVGLLDGVIRGRALDT